MLDLKTVFDKYNDEYLKFTRIEHPEHRRPDICAFIMLDRIVPAIKHNLGYYNDMVSHSEHDEIWLDVDVEELAKHATETEIRDLVRCGVRYDISYDCLAMFT